MQFGNVVRLFLCGLLLVLAGCASSPQKPNADAATLAQAAYRDPGAPSMMLITMVNNRTGKGGHTSLMVNASQRVIFDPAGSFKADVVPEYNDVLYGITPAVFKAYRGSHARETFHVVTQEVALTPAQAERAFQLVTSNGRVPGAYCANATSGIMAQIPGFESIDRTFFPVRLQEQFGTLPGVITQRYYENDSEDLQVGIAANNAQLNAQ
ncbi:hypothetical protein TRM7557_00685 [Tritonibacter multivorans]|uniref:Lipoprotein n=1 Tax=Tritonibacter multivorans TaxID=928856 RepID=A0A0P1GKT9_9RHOB|nr:hypothetical protein [Tritonibacter multivorans]MDA7419721.1 hypothetical protein [Tritonibacter multivorans]CUH76044.1 hypothetical protein TRM7557_00685 [Tritonibacter multivorans]SFC56376.1 hypothetical protein SAMN04488049_10397 [Tritonibacter multivorans]